MPKWEIRRQITTITYIEALSIEDIKVVIREKLLKPEDLVNCADILTTSGTWSIQPVNPEDGVAVQVADEDLTYATFVIPLENI